MCRASAQARRSRSTANTEPSGPTASASGSENNPRARVEVGRRRSGTVAHGGEDGVQERLGRAAMGLPEHAGRDPIAPAPHGDVDGARRPADLPPHDEPGLDAGAGQVRRPPATAWRDGDHRLAWRRTGDDLELGRARPARRERARREHGRVRHRAIVNVLEPMRAVPAEADGAVAVHRQAQAGAPPETLGVPVDRLDLDGALDPGQLAEQLGDAGRLEASLGAELDVLEVAPAAAIRAGVWARRHDPVRGRAQHLDGVERAGTSWSRP